MCIRDRGQREVGAWERGAGPQPFTRNPFSQESRPLALLIQSESQSENGPHGPVFLDEMTCRDRTKLRATGLTTGGEPPATSAPAPVLRSVALLSGATRRHPELCEYLHLLFLRCGPGMQGRSRNTLPQYPAARPRLSHTRCQGRIAPGHFLFWQPCGTSWRLARNPGKHLRRERTASRDWILPRRSPGRQPCDTM